MFLTFRERERERASLFVCKKDIKLIIGNDDDLKKNGKNQFTGGSIT